LPTFDASFTSAGAERDEAERKLDERTTERDEALARETALPEVLQAMNSSRGEAVSTRLVSRTRDVHGVVLTEGDVDAQATRPLRQGRRAARRQNTPSISGRRARNGSAATA
jgi:hypothetical protein